MGVLDDSAESVFSSNRAVVVRSLSTNVAILRPAQRPGLVLSLLAEQGVLLLNTEPWLFLEAAVEHLFGMCSEVGICWNKFRAGVVLPYEGLGHDDDVVALSEWISEVSDGLHKEFSDVGNMFSMHVATIFPVGNVGERSDF